MKQSNSQEDLIEYYNNGAILYNKLSKCSIVKKGNKHYVYPVCNRNGTFSFDNYDAWLVSNNQSDKMLLTIIQNGKLLRLNKKAFDKGVIGKYKEVVLKKSLKNKLKPFKHSIKQAIYKTKKILGL